MRKPKYDRLRSMLKRAGDEGLFASEIAKKLGTDKPMSFVRELEKHGDRVERFPNRGSEKGTRVVWRGRAWADQPDRADLHQVDSGSAAPASESERNGDLSDPPPAGAADRGPLQIFATEEEWAEANRRLKDGRIPPHAIRKQIPAEVREQLQGGETYGYRCECGVERSAPAGHCQGCGSAELAELVIYPPADPTDLCATDEAA